MVALVVLPAAIAAVLAALALGTFLLDGKGLALEPDDPLLLRAASGTPVYLTLVALLGFALGAISRSTAATVATLTLVLFLTPVLVGLVAPLEPVLRWLPSQAGQAVLQPEGTPGYLDPWVGLTVLAGYVAVCMCGAAYRFCTRDA